ncbi:nucleoside recognition domain-containing protein [Rhizobium sp. BK068]|uniref:nucleoside recognition domain-containing protein n=1 Tax=Rhizobium sp. BK068 TaxID=2512130 RepID=UPI001043553C|nr:nucleoside recognition domain-containing protein [Rhizobium sp. BK068]TCM65731.1 hypothetical protein EV291_1429 [Rhizobium sp. BK068]
MREFIDLILDAGRAAVDVSLYTLLPIMIVMTILLRFLEVYGVVDKVMIFGGPLLRPFGLSGMSAVALLQTALVSFAAPLPTLATMERRDIPDREIAATLAAVLAIAPANGLFPMAAYGVHTTEILLISFMCALAASACCYYVFGRSLGDGEFKTPICERVPAVAGSLKIIEAGGAEAIATVFRLIPMLLLSLSIVHCIQGLGIFAATQTLVQPVLARTGLSPDLVAPSFVGYVGGSTALVGYYDKIGRGTFLPPSLSSNAAMGFFVHSVNLVTVALLFSAGPKIARATPPAIAAALVGITLRVGIGLLI